MLSKYGPQVTIIVLVVVVLLAGIGAMPFSEQPSTPVTATNWKYCTDAKQGFSLQYPSDVFQPDAASGECSLLLVADNSIPAQQALYVFVLDNPERLSLVDWLASPYARANEGLQRRIGDIGVEYKTIGNREWIAFDRNDTGFGFPPSGHIYWAILHENKVFLVGLLNMDIDQYGSVVEQVLATFQPLDPSITP